MEGITLIECSSIFSPSFMLLFVVLPSQAMEAPEFLGPDSVAGKLPRLQILILSVRSKFLCSGDLRQKCHKVSKTPKAMGGVPAKVCHIPSSAAASRWDSCASSLPKQPVTECVKMNALQYKPSTGIWFKRMLMFYWTKWLLE